MLITCDEILMDSRTNFLETLIELIVCLLIWKLFCGILDAGNSDTLRYLVSNALGWALM